MISHVLNVSRRVPIRALVAGLVVLLIAVLLPATSADARPAGPEGTFGSTDGGGAHQDPAE
jgi:hypothetical protein